MNFHSHIKMFLLLIIAILLLHHPLSVYASNNSHQQITLLGQTKSTLPTSQETNTLYSGFSTRVKNTGLITKIKMYYVLAENSNLTCHIMDTDLDILYSTPSHYTPSGHGYITFDINKFSTSSPEIYIALESDKKSLGLGTVLESKTITNYVTSHNAINGIENAQKLSANDSWTKEHGTLKGGISLYIETYGYLTQINSTPKNIYVSSSAGNDNNDGKSPNTPFKSIARTLALYNTNTNIYLKSGDTFYEPIGLQLNNINNLTLSSYNGTEFPKICGLQPTLIKKSSVKNVYSFSIPNDIGHLLLSDQLSWKRITTNKLLTNNGEYYVNLSDNTVLLYLEQIPDNNYIYYSNGTHGISIKNSSNINISNLEICNFGKHGISISTNSTNIIINNNKIHDIGGATLNDVKYGNGIECWLNGLFDISISNNTVYNCFDAGITPQIKSSETYNNANIFITENEIYNCTYPIEYFNASTTESSCQNIIISSNYIHNCTDITHGYRENAATSFNAFFCMWRSSGNDSVIVKDNLCINSDGHSISFSMDSNNKIYFTNNKFITNKNQSIKNNDYFYGDNNEFYNVTCLPHKTSIINHHNNQLKKD